MAFPDIGHGGVQRGPGRGQRTDRDAQPLLGQTVGQLLEGCPLLPQQVLDRHPHVGERQFDGVLHLQADLRQIAALLEARHAVLDDQQAEPPPPVGLASRGSRHHDHQVGERTPADERLRAVEHIVLAVPDRGRAHAGQVRTSARFGHPDRREQVAAHQAREPAPTLRLVGVVQEIRNHHVQVYL